jgi:hypothetical protein
MVYVVVLATKEEYLFLPGIESVVTCYLLHSGFFAWFILRS